MKKKRTNGSLKGTIICIHGNSSSSSVFESLLNTDLIKHKVILIDLPGHGDSVQEYKNHSDFSISFFKEKLINFINTIDDEILLIGNSIGGHLALEIINEVKRLKGLVIFGAPPLKKPINFEEAFLPVEALQTFLTENPSEKSIINAAIIALINKDSIESFIFDFKKTNPLVRKNIAEDILGNKLANEYEYFTKSKVPKFIIAGNNDPSVSKDYLKKTCSDSVNCEFILFENCGHYPSLEKPKEFIKALNYISKKVF